MQPKQSQNPNSRLVVKLVGVVFGMFAFGFALGGKFATNNGFVFEFFAGVGRNIIESDKDISTSAVPRLGASVGYRF